MVQCAIHSLFNLPKILVFLNLCVRFCDLITHTHTYITYLPVIHFLLKVNKVPIHCVPLLLTVFASKKSLTIAIFGFSKDPTESKMVGSNGTMIAIRLVRRLVLLFLLKSHVIAIGMEIEGGFLFAANFANAKSTPTRSIP